VTFKIFGVRKFRSAFENGFIYLIMDARGALNKSKLWKRLIMQAWSMVTESPASLPYLSKDINGQPQPTDAVLKLETSTTGHGMR